MKLVAIIVLVVALLTCCLAQPMGQAGMGAQTAQQQPPNILQYLLLQNMFDAHWLPLMLMSGRGGGGGNSIFPWLLWGNM